MLPIVKAVAVGLAALWAHKFVKRLVMFLVLLLVAAGVGLYFYGGPVLVYVLKTGVRQKTGAELTLGKWEIAFFSGRAVLDDMSIERHNCMSVRIPRVTIVSGPWRHLVGRKQIETVTLDRAVVHLVDDDKEKELAETYVGITDLTITDTQITIVDPTRPEAVREIKLAKLAIDHARFSSLDHMSVLRTAKRIEAELTLAGSTGRLFVGDRDGKRVWEFIDIDLKAIEALWPNASKLPFSAGRADVTCTFGKDGSRMRVVLRSAKPDKSKVSLQNLILTGLSAALGSATYEFPIDYDAENMRGSIGEALRKLWVAMGEGVLADVLRRIR